MSPTPPQPLPDTITFKARGLPPDTRLTVFSTTFYVHSTILKLKSAFFSKFMDSPDKTPLPDNGDGIKYHWVTAEEVGGWSLVAANGPKRDAEGRRDTPVDGEVSTHIENNSDLEDTGEKGESTGTKGPTAAQLRDCAWLGFDDTGEQVSVDQYNELQTRLFDQLLRAMYGRPITLIEGKENSVFYLVEMADYYCALPALSAAVPHMLAGHIQEIARSLRPNQDGEYDVVGQRQMECYECVLMR